MTDCGRLQHELTETDDIPDVALKYFKFTLEKKYSRSEKCDLKLFKC